MSNAAKIAYQMVLHIPKEMGGDNTGSVIIAPFNTTDDQQGWQLWTRTRSDADAKKAEHQIRGYIEEAINAGCAAALTRAEAAEQRARVLAEEVRAWRAWNVADQLVGTADEVDVNANNHWSFVELAMSATDAANALGDGR